MIHLGVIIQSTAEKNLPAWLHDVTYYITCMSMILRWGKKRLNTIWYNRRSIQHWLLHVIFHCHMLLNEIRLAFRPMRSWSFWKWSHWKSLQQMKFQLKNCKWHCNDEPHRAIFTQDVGCIAYCMDPWSIPGVQIRGYEGHVSKGPEDLSEIHGSNKTVCQVQVWVLVLLVLLVLLLLLLLLLRLLLVLLVVVVVVPSCSSDFDIGHRHFWLHSVTDHLILLAILSFLTLPYASHARIWRGWYVVFQHYMVTQLIVCAPTLYRGASQH